MRAGAILSAVVHAVAVRTRIAQDRAFDRRYDVDTVKPVPTDELALPRGGADGQAYEATSIGDLRRMLRVVRLRPERTTFVDLGCGKGRVLALAAEKGFARVIGVEADPTVAAIARRNVERWPHQRSRAGAIEVVAADAAAYPYPPGDLLIYLYNPFGGKTFSAVVQRLAALSREPGRRVEILYYNNVLADRIDASGAFKRSDLRPRLPWRRATISLHRSFD